ncbi:uncharacterized protein BO97DRAFT_391953 [Aspergillus homomorphus CBS 101889]|uniref:Uncharacterized protein n=1 Tax=Aspergillus homomorphus (strain CBS 101889) TaxID=1450537 RepID=A0A395HV94_ASPHC|nr:hypothetical protein BO97DRAFT_391953 [Aspergillus homomorphus CBS 101889]RAL11449.1 hypothetical protein BO97DRAFT_391953 [Aspergillus homomorphus CBS 101889]
MMVTSSLGEDAGHPSRQHLPPIPPSPTLSNPDMILPFDSNERESSTPSPPFNLPSLGNLQAFYERRPALDDNTDHNQGVAQLGIALSYGSRPQKKGFPRHAWLQEGHDARRLSDIGEEDSSSSSSYAHFPGFSGASRMVSQTGRLEGSPVSQRETADSDTRETGAWSGSSSSTASGASDSSWDGAKGHHDSRGAEEPRHNLEDSVREPVNGNDDTPSIMATAHENGSGVELSSAVLSTEAERILENAKKRLTLMEGNLSRARTSVRVSPSLPTSPTPPVGQSPLGLGQPVGGLYQSISRADRRVSNHRPRTTYSSSQDVTSNRHSRVYSETKLPSAAQSSLSTADTNPSRSLSALGSTSASTYRSDERTFRYDPTRSYLTHRASISSMQRPPARSPPMVKERASSESPKGLGISTDEIESLSPSTEGSNETYPAQDPPSRSQSQMQVRDLHNQMKGLHIKISSLKVKTQEDNLRRRSMQSLRTPSPLNAADQWYPNALDLKGRHNNLKPNGAQGQSSSHSAENLYRGEFGSAVRIEPDTKTRQAETREQVAAHHPTGYTGHQPEDGSELDDSQSVSESLYEDAQEGNYDESGFLTSDADRESLDDNLDDTLEAFPPVPQSFQDTPHEEREDAFDYEHFILHSALGNYTQARLRRESNGSTSSVETTRPTDHRSVRHSRANSTPSLSSVATFETAIEGNHDGLESVLYWDRKFNDEFKNRHPAGGESSEGADMEDESNPRTLRRQPNRLVSSDKDSKVNLMPPRSESAMTGAATPTSLASSLVSTVRAASSSHTSASANGNMGLNDDDTQLLEQLFQSLGDVCTELQTITTSAHPDLKQVRLLRRRLDAARRVLDGELDT